MRLVAYGLTMVSNSLITCLINLAVLVGDSELTGGEIELTSEPCAFLLKLEDLHVQPCMRVRGMLGESRRVAFLGLEIVSEDRPLIFKIPDPVYIFAALFVGVLELHATPPERDTKRLRMLLGAGLG